MYLDFKKWLQVFLLNASLGDIEFYNFSVDQSWYNGQSVQLLRRVWLFMTPWTAAQQAYLSITNPCRLLELKSIKSVMPPNHLILSSPSPPAFKSFPALGSFPMGQFFTSGSQNIGASASVSVLPMNIRGWFPLGLTSLISLQSKRFSRVFSNTTVWKHQFFGAQISLRPSTHIHTWLLEKP